MRVIETTRYFQKQAASIEAASIVQVSPSYKGKDSGTAGARPFRIQDNERLFGNDDLSNILAIPENWAQLSVTDRAKFLIPEVSKGRLRYPRDVDDFAKRLFEYRPDLFFHALFTCITSTGKFPNFTRDWLEMSWKRRSLPKELQAAIQHQLRIFPQPQNNLSMLYDDYPDRSRNINRT
jgi:hypothetical protein